MKWFILLSILCILQTIKCQQVKDEQIPQQIQYHLGDLLNKCIRFNQCNVDSNIAKHIKKLIFAKHSYREDRTKRFLHSRSFNYLYDLFPSLNDAIDSSYVYMTGKVQRNYKQINERFKELIHEIFNRDKNNERPATSESIVSNNSKQPEDLNQIVPKSDESIVDRKLVPVAKDDKKEKPAEQGNKEDTPAPIKDDENAYTIASPSNDERMTSTTDESSGNNN